MIAAVIFDLYGTLLQLPEDSRPFLQLAQRSGDVRSALKTALTTDNRTLAGFAGRIGLPVQDDQQSLEALLAKDITTIQPFADTKPTLRKLRERGIQTAVISNLATPYKHPFFEHQLDALIDIVVFSCDCGLLKPSSEIYEYALKQLGTSPTESMMVGDSFGADVAGPSRIGIMAVHLVRSGGLSKAACMVSSLDGILDKAK